MEKSTFEAHKTCLDCRFMDRLVEPETSKLVTICRLNPPIVAHAFMPTSNGGGQILQQSLFPVMANGDWCGKLETRPN
jgi:hypothetical protein